MNQIKPIYLLAGGQHRDPSGMVASLKRALQECGAKQPRVAYVGTASKDNLLFFNAVKALLHKSGAGEVDLVRLSKPKADIPLAKKLLESADAIFLSGGEVEDGMVGLERHGLISFLKELYRGGKLFIGVSAGSIMMGTHWVRWEDPKDDSTAELFDCLGFVPTVFDTHAEDEDWIELKTTLWLLGHGARGYGIPRDGTVCADSLGKLVTIEKTLLCFTNNNGQVSLKQ